MYNAISQFSFISCDSPTDKIPELGNDSSKLPPTNNTSNRHINTCCVTGSITEEIYICSSQLLGQCQSRHTSIVFHLSLPIWLLLNIVCEGSLDIAGRDTVDSDTVLCPFHSEGVGHIANSGFCGSVWCRWRSLLLVSSPFLSRQISERRNLLCLVYMKS